MAARVLAGDRTYGMACAVWALLVGAAFLGVFAAVAYAISR